MDVLLLSGLVFFIVEMRFIFLLVLISLTLCCVTRNERIENNVSATVADGLTGCRASGPVQSYELWIFKLRFSRFWAARPFEVALDCGADQGLQASMETTLYVDRMDGSWNNHCEG